MPESRQSEQQPLSPPSRQRLFVRALAEFLAGEPALKSIALELESKRRPVMPWAAEWAKLRAASPLFGYQSVDEAEKKLLEFLNVSK